jgi:hypothetical protein
MANETYEMKTNFLNDRTPYQPSAAELEDIARQSRIARIEAQAQREFEQEQRREAARTKSQAGWDGIAQTREKDTAFISEKVDTFKDIATKGFLLVAASVAVVSFGGIAVGAGALVAGAWGGALTAVGTTLANGAFWAGIGQAGSAVAAAAIGTYAWRGITGHSQGHQALKDTKMGIETVEQVKARLRAQAEGIAPKTQPSVGSTTEANNAIAKLQQQLEELRAALAEEKRKNPVTTGAVVEHANDDNAATEQVINIETSTASAPHGELAHHLEATEPANGALGKSYSLRNEDSISFILNSSNIPEARASTANDWDRTMYGENISTSMITAKALLANVTFKQEAARCDDVVIYKGIITGRDYTKNGSKAELSDGKAEEFAKLAVLGAALSETLPVCIQGETKTPLFVGSTGIEIHKSFKEICARNGWEATPETAKQAIDMYEELKGEKARAVELRQYFVSNNQNIK